MKYGYPLSETNPMESAEPGGRRAVYATLQPDQSGKDADMMLQIEITPPVVSGDGLEVVCEVAIRNGDKSKSFKYGRSFAQGNSMSDGHQIVIRGAEGVAHKIIRQIESSEFKQGILSREKWAEWRCGLGVSA